MNNYNILAINPGSTSTKIAVFKGEDQVFEVTLRHTSEELSGFDKITDQYTFRKDIIIGALQHAGIDPAGFDAVIGRGGLIKPIPSGVYEVNQKLQDDLRSGIYGEHASNLGGLIAADMASVCNCRAFIADPVVVDELQDVARVSGLPELERKSIFHALNQKAIARRYAESIGKVYEDMNLVVAHLGGGISVGAHRKGMVIDVNNALDGEGPFSPERAGTLPAGQLAAMCFDGSLSKAEMKKKITGNGGLVAHLGTNDTRGAIALGNEGNTMAQTVIDAMCYGISKSIGSMATVLFGEVDAIILTGGIAYNECICDYIEEMVAFIAPVVVIPGENELEALAFNALRVLHGKEEPRQYS